MKLSEITVFSLDDQIMIWSQIMCALNNNIISKVDNVFVYYISVLATQFNCAQQAPDVIQDTYSGSTSPTNSVTAVGFRSVQLAGKIIRVITMAYNIMPCG